MTRFLQDILNEPDQLQRSLAYTLGAGRSALEEAARLLRAADHLYITGIGSSWHAGMAISSLFHADGHPVLLFDASELLHFARLPAGTAMALLSRSGRSVEVVRLLEKARREGAKVVGITNTPDSPLGEQAEVTLRLEAAFDHNVSVSMYSALALVGGLLASATLGALDDALTESLRQALAAVKESIPAWRAQMGSSGWFIADAPASYFLARGGSLASCHETRLLWEEAAKSPATALTTGGFRHGPQEMLSPGTRIGLWIGGAHLRSEDLALAADLRRYGAKVMLIGQNLPPEAGDLVFNLPAIPAAWQFLIDIIPAQLAAEHLARARGVDCDTFRLCPYVVESEGGLGRGAE